MAAKFISKVASQNIAFLASEQAISHFSYAQKLSRLFKSWLETFFFQDIVIVDENLNNTDTEMRGDADFLSKTIITDSSLGECKMVASLND